MVDIFFDGSGLIFSLRFQVFAESLIIKRVEEIHLYEAAVLCHGTQHVIGHVARSIDQRTCGRMRGDHRGFRGGDGVPEGLVGDVRNVDHHAEAVHLEHDLLTEIGKAVVVLHFRVVDVARGIGPLVGVRPRKCHVTHAEAIVITQHVHIVLDRVPTFNAHERGELVLAVSALDVGDRESHHHAIGMVRRLLINRINQIESVLGEMALVRLWLNPYGEKFRTEISSPCFVETDVSDVVWVRRTDVEVLVEKTLWRVGVGIDD